MELQADGAFHDEGMIPALDLFPGVRPVWRLHREQRLFERVTTRLRPRDIVPLEVLAERELLSTPRYTKSPFQALCGVEVRDNEAPPCVQEALTVFSPIVTDEEAPIEISLQRLWKDGGKLRDRYE